MAVYRLSNIHLHMSEGVGVERDGGLRAFGAQADALIDRT
jgi:hypothetical protein